MRILLHWKTKTPLELPVAYHQILQGIIYHNLRNTYGFSDFLHGEGYSKEQRSFRMFCFGPLTGPCQVKNKRIVFYEDVSWEITSPSVYLTRALVDSVEKNGLRFGETYYSNVEVFVSDLEVEQNEVLVRAMSPIVVYKTDPETKWTQYFQPGEEIFYRAVNENFHRKYMAYYGLPANEDICMSPLEVGERDKCVTQYKGTYITGYTGIYRLKGRRQYLNFLYQTGVGAKNAQGFGLIEMVN